MPLSEVTPKTLLEMLPFEIFRFRILIEREGPIVVATCLETGSVATADDQDMVVDMMTELLIDEWTFNVQHCSLHNLLSPAPMTTWMRWNRAPEAITTRDGIEWKLLPEEQP
jgi:hypothetical protein